MKRRLVFTASGLSRRAILGRAAATGAALGLTTHLGRAVAQDATPSAPAAGAVGAWRVTVVPPLGGVPHAGLVTFAADGTLNVATQPVQPTPPGSPFAAVIFSGGHGVWEPAAEGIAFVGEFVGAGPDGTPFGVLTLRGRVTLGSDGRTLSATYDLTVTTADSAAVPAGQGSFEGTRLTVEDPASPGPETYPVGTPTG